MSNKLYIRAVNQSFTVRAVDAAARYHKEVYGEYEENFVDITAELYYSKITAYK